MNAQEPPRHAGRLRLGGAGRSREIGVINPILMGVSSAAQALETLFATTKASPASSSPGTFSTGQGLPAGPSASPQAAPSNASNKFAPAALGFLTALQDPESAAAGFAHGAEGAIGQDISGVGSVLEKLKNALTAGASGSASASASALSIGSAAAGGLSVATTSVLVGALGQLTSALAGSGGALHHIHHHNGGMGMGSSTAIASASASPLSLSSATAS
jgi:hypothetical protein